MTDLTHHYALIPHFEESTKDYGKIGVIAYSATRFSFPLNVAVDSFIATYPEIRTMVIFCRAEDYPEFLMCHKDSVDILRIDCNPIGPEPFLGPKVCIYDLPKYLKFQTAFYFDLDVVHLNHFEGVNSEEDILHVALDQSEHDFDKALMGTVYNALESDLERYPSLRDVYGFKYPAETELPPIALAFNAGMFVASYTMYAQLRRHVHSLLTYTNLGSWVFHPERTKGFWQSREQALFSIALNRMRIFNPGSIKLAPQMNFQMYRQDIEGWKDQCALHFCGYFIEDGLSRKNFAALREQIT